MLLEPWDASKTPPSLISAASTAAGSDKKALGSSSSRGLVSRFPRVDRDQRSMPTARIVRSYQALALRCDKWSETCTLADKRSSTKLRLGAGSWVREAHASRACDLACGRTVPAIALRMPCLSVT